MATPLCNSPYERPDGTVLRCQHPASVPGHPQETHDHPLGDRLVHSWEAIQQTDEDERRKAASLPCAPDALMLVSEVSAGAWDEWLELILNAAHNRKKALRGVAGFTGREVYGPVGRPARRKRFGR